MRVEAAALLIVGILAANAAPATAQIENSANTLKLAPDASSPPASIGDVAWLAGLWKGTGLGGRSEEMWAPPEGDRMHGHYALIKEEGEVFSEAMLLVEEDRSLVLKVRHFTAEFIAWEEKDKYVSFPLVKLGENEAYFSGLTFRRSGDSLSIFLVLSSGGKRTEHSFQLERVPL